MLVLSASEVAELLDLDQLVDAVESAMVDLSAGKASMPSRVAAGVADRHAMLAAMPAFLPSAKALTTKLVSLFPDNRDRPTHHALICCFDPANGTPLAVMDGTYVTAARTAAGSALATRLLARHDAKVAAVIGTGVQARAHARALIRLPVVEVVCVAGRDQTKVDDLIDDLGATGVATHAAPSVEDASGPLTLSARPPTPTSQSCGTTGCGRALTSTQSATTLLVRAKLTPPPSAMR